MPRYKVRGIIIDGKVKVTQAWKQYSTNPTRPNGTIVRSKQSGGGFPIWDCHIDAEEIKEARICSAILVAAQLMEQQRKPK